jgi:preprotein translocase subunit SecD
MVGLMFAVGQQTPKLALDLAGGTTVTLTAVTESGKTPPSSQMNQAVSIMRNRVNGLGVSEADVTRQGNDVIIVQVPGQGQQRVVDLIGTTAKLQFRQVFAEAAGTPVTASPSPSTSASGTTSPKATTSPKTSTSPKASVSGASPTPSATTSAKQRALSSVLTKATTTPTPSSSAKASASPSPSASPTPSASSGSAASGPSQAVITRYEKADCTDTKTRKLDGANNDKSQWVAACAQDGSTKYILGPVRVQGQQVKSAQALAPNLQQGQSSWTVQLNFKSAGADQFYKLTQDTYAAYKQSSSSPQALSAIILDGEVVTAVNNSNGPIAGGTAQIYGSASTFTQQYASDLAQVLNYGALPLDFKKSAVESVSATLGQAQLQAGLWAGTIGLALVVLYCLLYYRALGFVAIFSLVVSGILTYESVVLLGHFINFRLSLAGIAGLIVAIGITADSFVVYFERLRDEVREGRSLRSAVERGWERARRTVLVADAVSFLAALVLYLVSIGSVKGFAFTLGLTTLIDVAVVFLFTKPMVSGLARVPFFGQGHPMSGLDPRRLGAKKRTTGSKGTGTPVTGEA